MLHVSNGARRTERAENHFDCLPGSSFGSVFPQLHSNSDCHDLHFPQTAAQRLLPQSRTACSTRGMTAAPHPAAHGSAFETLLEDGDGWHASSLRLPGNSVLSVTVFEKKKIRINRRTTFSCSKKKKQKTKPGEDAAAEITDTKFCTNMNWFDR